MKLYIQARKKAQANHTRKVMSKAATNMPSYHKRVDGALDAWGNENLAYAARQFSVLAQSPEATDIERQHWLDMAEGCKILAGQIKTPDSFTEPCSKCAHARYWHVLQIACIQCLDHDTQESACKAFVPQDLK